MDRRGGDSSLSIPLSGRVYSCTIPQSSKTTKSKTTLTLAPEVLVQLLVDADVRESYEDPDILLEGGDASGEPASRTVPRGGGLSTAELVNLRVLLDRAGILLLVPAEEAEDISQVFGQR